VPTIVALREKLEALRQQELERTLSAMGDLDPKQRQAIERLSVTLVNKILHTPVTTLRRHQADRAEPFYIEAARRLFRLGAAATTTRRSSGVDAPGFASYARERPRPRTGRSGASRARGRPRGAQGRDGLHPYERGRRAQGALGAGGVKGLFVKEIEERFSPARSTRVCIP